MARKFSIILCVIFFVLSLSFVSCAKNDEPLGYEITTLHRENGVDFSIDFETGRDIRVLQLADIQLTDLNNARNESRYYQLYFAEFYHGISSHQERAWRYVDEAISLCKPDLIVLTGDNIFGETDDDGSDWLELIQKMDGYKIPWLTTFGNHDNESAKGVLWQVDRLKESEYCLFEQGDVSGNSNYNVLIKQGGETKYLFYLIDTNGCSVKGWNPGEGLPFKNVDIDHLITIAGVEPDQVKWFAQSYEKASAVYGEVPVLTFMHIPPDEVINSVYESEEIVINKKFNDGTHFGIFKEYHVGIPPNDALFETMLNSNCQGIFVGHQHEIATSTVYAGIRFTYGLKTGTYSYHNRDLIGSTQISLKSDGGFEVKYLFTKLKYILN